MTQRRKAKTISRTPIKLPKTEPVREPIDSPPEKNVVLPPEKIVSLDTETNGLDMKHGAKPFFVTSCDNNINQKYWEWDVDPLTREPQIPYEDKEELREYLDSLLEENTTVVLQNTKFDVAALKTILPDIALFDPVIRFDQKRMRRRPWGNIRDTLIAGHLLASNLDHDLTYMAMQYLRENIKPVEDAVEQATKDARSFARRKLKNWHIAREDDETMPSATDKTWKFDMWLPRALVKYEWEKSPAYNNLQNLIKKLKKTHLDFPEDMKLLPSWVSRWIGWKLRPPEMGGEDERWTVLASYANTDSAITVGLWMAQWKEIQRRKLDKIFLVSMEKQRLAHRMEDHGVTFSGGRLDEQEAEYREESDAAGCKCINIAKSMGYELKLPKGAVNDSIRGFVFDVLKMEGIRGKKSKTNNPSLDKNIIEHYLMTLDNKSIAYSFIKNLAAKRKRDTALAFIGSYRRFSRPYYNKYLIPDLGRWVQKMVEDWFVLYPSLNPTGTDTLRWSSQNPNEQNISKKEGFNLRYSFGPAPGREWWSMDAENIELRIPAYEANEKEMLALFERPKDPPYFGSNHLLVAHILHPEKFEACKNSDGVVDGRLFKEKYDSTLYQWVKNGNFAVQYGAVEQSGTADRAYHVEGAQRLIQQRFKNIAKLNRTMIRFAENYGYVETIPDKTIDPERGYPILCTRTQWNKILPTVPLNYHVQGTAMWWMMKAMIRCQAYLDSINTDTRFGQAFMVMQVHDELVFDFPAGTGEEPWKTNFSHIEMLRKLMAQGGDDIGIPIPVSVKYHTDNWSKGVKL